MELHDVILAARQEHGLTQQALADRTGASSRTVRRWEAGSSGPSGRQLHALRQVLRLNGDGLVELSGGPSHRRAAASAYRKLLAEDPSIRSPLEPLPFGWRLRQGMSWRGLDAADVAGALRVNPATVRRWVRGGGPPRWSQQHQVAELLDLPVWWLHTTYLDSCELLGHPAHHLHTDRSEIARLAAQMQRPDGWNYEQTVIDEELMAGIASRHDLPLDDLRRAAYPLGAGRRRSPRTFQPSAPPDWPVGRRLSAALNDLRDLEGRQRPRDEAVVFVAQVVDVAEETVHRWAAGSSEPTAVQVYAAGEALGLPSWQLWLP